MWGPVNRLVLRRGHVTQVGMNPTNHREPPHPSYVDCTVACAFRFVCHKTFIVFKCFFFPYQAVLRSRISITGMHSSRRTAITRVTSLALHTHTQFPVIYHLKHLLCRCRYDPLAICVGEKGLQRLMQLKAFLVNLFTLIYCCFQYFRTVTTLKPTH